MTNRYRELITAVSENLQPTTDTLKPTTKQEEVAVATQPTLTHYIAQMLRKARQKKAKR